MSYELLEEKLRRIPEKELGFVSQVLDFVLSRSELAEETKHAEKRIRRRPGALKGKIWMAPDFDETPECFKEYM